MVTLAIIFLALPAMILCRKLGPRIVQVMGASLNAAGLLATAFTVESWQALITNGIIAGN